MNARQTKISLETSKEVANDKTLKTKQEKDRRLREKKQNNTKKFMDERKVFLFLVRYFWQSGRGYADLARVPVSIALCYNIWLK